MFYLDKLDIIPIEVNIIASVWPLVLSLSQPIELLDKRLHGVLRQRLIFGVSCATNIGIKFLLNCEKVKKRYILVTFRKKIKYSDRKFLHF